MCSERKREEKEGKGRITREQEGRENEEEKKGKSSRNLLKCIAEKGAALNHIRTQCSTHILNMQNFINFVSAYRHV